MSHLVIDFDKEAVDDSKSSDHSEESKESRQALNYVNQIVRSDKKIDRRLVLLHKALNSTDSAE